MGFRAWGLGFGLSDLSFGFKGWGLGFKGLGPRLVWALRFRVEGLGFRV